MLGEAFWDCGTFGLVFRNLGEPECGDCSCSHATNASRKLGMLC
jgi:hypothetical protein